MNYRDVACPNCGTVYAVGYSDVPHSVEFQFTHPRGVRYMKGGHTHNHQRNALERKLNRSKDSRNRCHNVLNKGYEYKPKYNGIFWKVEKSVFGKKKINEIQANRQVQVPC